MWGLNTDDTKVTVELREIVESGVDIWAFDYPSYYKDEAKKAFEKKVLDHYWFRQIGQETVGRFLHYFRTRIREIMPYYLDVYASVDLLKNQGDPLEAYNLTETIQRNITSTDDTTSTSEGQRSGSNDLTRKFSNTPQGQIDDIDRYMTEATKENGTATEDNSGTVTSTSTGGSTETYTMTRRGNIGVQTLGYEINQYRDALINVDKMIIDELKDLFLMVY